MKIVSFKFGDTESYGVVEGDGVIDVGIRQEKGLKDVRAVLEAGALDEVRQIATGHAPDHALDDITFLPPVTNPDMIICVGMNYQSAFDEVGREFPGHPSLFMRRASAQVGHNQSIRKPAASTQFDCEAEVAIVIGKGGTEIPVEEAMGYIAGYSIFNDASAVDWMRHTKENVTPGKNFDGSGAFGPWMVTADEIADPSSLSISHLLNGEKIQEGPLTDMCYGIAQQINYISTFTTLKPGDVISTGSPGGIRSRREAGSWVQPGDVIDMIVDGIGTLHTPVI